MWGYQDDPFDNKNMSLLIIILRPYYIYTCTLINIGL